MTTCTRAMTGSTTISINALPDAFAVSGGGGYCPGGAGVAVGMANSTSGITYRLYKGATQVGSTVSTGGALTFGMQTAVGIYTVSAINSATGCVKNMTGTATVSINALPAVFNVTGSGSYCEGADGTNVGLSGTEAGVQYQLYMGSTAVGSPVTAASFGLQTAGTYTVLATNTTTSCVRAMAGSATVTITPTVTPTVVAELSTGNPVCAGTSVLYTATGTNGGTTPAYQWVVNASVMPGASNATFIYTPSDGDVVRVDMTSSEACAVPAIVSDIATMTVSANQTPVVTIAPDVAGAICKGLSVTFTATPDYGGTMPVYSWMKNGVAVGSGATYTVAPEDKDVVSCTMTSNYTCRTVNNVTSNKDTMDVVEVTVPTVVITTEEDITTIQVGQYVTFNATISNAGPSPEMQWIINGEAIVGATTTAFITNLLEDGDTITCRVLSSGPCGGNYSFNTIVIHLSSVGVANVPAVDMDVRVMPNPNKGEFTVKGILGTTTSEEVQVEMTNMLGQVIYSKTVRSNQGSINEHVSLDNGLANGIYLLNIRSGNSSKVFHVTVGR